MSSVTVDQVSKAYGTTRVVHALSFDVADGEFVVILGPSGCGKTTLLNMIAGLTGVDSGTILLDGDRIDSLSTNRRNLAMVFQSIALYPHLSAYRNIAFPLRMAKVPRGQIEQRVLHTAELLRIEHLLDRMPHELSGGQRQRVALGRAVIRKPRAFLFDEPLSSLDAKLRGEMRLELKKLHERLRATFIYVTHDQIEALTMADRIAVMSNGRVLQYGSPNEIYNCPADVGVASFVGSLGMNLVEGRIENGSGEQLMFESEGFSFPIPPPMRESAAALSGYVRLGIRPERVIAGEVPTGAPSARGRVFGVESVGSDLIVDLVFHQLDDRNLASLDARSFKLRTSPEFNIRIGDSLLVALPEDHLLLFGEDGRRVYP